MCIFQLPKQGNTAHYGCFSPDYKRVAVLAASSEGGSVSYSDGQQSIYLFDVPPRAFDPVEARFDDAPLDRLWTDLGTSNDLRLQMVLKVFRSAPRQTVELIGQKVQPVARELQREVEKLLAKLDDESFERQRFTAMMENGRAYQFAPLLKAKLKQLPAGQVHGFFTYMVNEMYEGKQPAALAAQLRAVALLEELATKEARDLLERLADGADGARLTTEARAALDRLKSKASVEKGRNGSRAEPFWFQRAKRLAWTCGDIQGMGLTQ